MFSVFTKEWLDGDAAVAGGRVAGVGQFEGGERVDGRGQYLVPGFIDAHVHIESSKLMVDEYARQVVACGTSAAVCDPHEIANVLGVDGALWILEASASLPIDVYVMAPPCVPASSFETPRGPLSAEDMRIILGRDRALGAAKVMNFPGVIAGDRDLLEKVDLPEATHADGHAPGVSGHGPRRLAAGISSDHESYELTRRPSRSVRARCGCFLREASNGPQPRRSLLPLVTRARNSILCGFLHRRPRARLHRSPRGPHQPDGAVCARPAWAWPPRRRAGARFPSAGPVGAWPHGERGAVAPGYWADLLAAARSRGSTVPTMVFKDGPSRGQRRSRRFAFPRVEVPAHVRDTMHVGARVRRRPGGFRSSPTSFASSGWIGGSTSSPTRWSMGPVGRSGGLAVADPSRDLAKTDVIERHHATGRVGKGFVHRLRRAGRGAFASTVVDDAHNIVVVGCSGMRTWPLAVASPDRHRRRALSWLLGRFGVLGELPLPDRRAALRPDRPAEVVERGSMPSPPALGRARRRPRRALHGAEVSSPSR